MLGIVRLESGVLLLRALHIFLVVVAADGERGHGDRVECVLNAARGPDGIVSGMIEEELPCGQQP